MEFQVQKVVTIFFAFVWFFSISYLVENVHDVIFGIHVFRYFVEAHRDLSFVRIDAFFRMLVSGLVVEEKIRREN